VIFYLWTAVVSLACLLVFTMQSFAWPAVVAITGGILCVIVTFTPLVRVRRWLGRRARDHAPGA